MTIDFEKAFDSLRWSFIQKSLEVFNFGPKYKYFIKTMYNDISTAVINNGFTSDWFSPGRGVRQGCPLSPYLFLLSAEILACNIRQNQNIDGLVINEIEIKISQLADDTTCFIKNEKSLKLLLETFNKFEDCAGLAINIDKTSARCLGGYFPSQEKLLGLAWSQEPVYTLGIYISGNETDHFNLNFMPKIVKMKQLLSSWKCRYLSLKGKITVINTLALSQIIYLCSIICVPDQVYSEVKKIVLDFLWDGKPAKIAYSTLIQSIENGGLKLIDLKSKVKSLTISWVRRLVDESLAKWKTIPKILYKSDDLNFYFSCNNLPLTENFQPIFYKNVQHYWSEMMQVHELSSSIIKNQVLWNNRYITIQNKCFYWKKWKEVGIIKVNDLMENSNFLSSNELSNKYNIQINFLEVLQIRQSLPYAWRNQMNLNEPFEIYNEIIYFDNKHVRLLNKADAKKVYSFFVSQDSHVPTCIDKWKTVYPNIFEGNWKDYFKFSFRISRETILQSFQYRILHRTITCRKKLHEMRLIDTSICTVCPEVDTIQHFFYHCLYVKHFWESIFNWLNNLFEFNSNINEREIIFGIEVENDIMFVINYVILHGKFYIYRNRVNNVHTLSLNAFKAQLRYKLEIEKIITMSKNPEIFVKFQSLFDDLSIF